MDETNRTEYRNWSEVKWKNPDIPDWHGCLITAGVDIGSTSTQAVIMADGQLYAYSSIRTGSDSPNSAVNAIQAAMKGTDLTIQDIHYTIGTGYGRVNVPFADKTVTEITCHARGANYIFGSSVRTILDMGGQDCKAIHCDATGKVTSFIMNDKCAAGTGRGMEVIANLLSVPIEEIGKISLSVEEEPEPVSTICVIFAKKELTNLLRAGWPIEKVLASYCRAMAIRVVRLLERNGIESDFAITGGIAKNIGIVRRIEQMLSMKAMQAKLDPQIAGALGGALIARDILQKQR